MQAACALSGTPHQEAKCPISTATPTPVLEAAPAASDPREDVLIILPVRNMVLFPGVVAPVTLSRPKTIAGAQEAVRTERKVGLLLQRQPDIDDPTPADLHPIGTVAGILRYVTTPTGAHQLVLEGERRFRVLDFQPGLPFHLARVEYLPGSNSHGTDVDARAHAEAPGAPRRSSCCRPCRPSSRPRCSRSTRPRRWPT